MERLTKRTADGILVKENYEKKSLKTLYSCYGEKPNSYYSNCEEGYCAMEKLADYEDAEEQGLLLRLPCGIGSDVYIIPSKINYELNILSLHPENNKVYHQKVALITFTEKDGTWSVIRIENMQQTESCQKKCTRKPGFYQKRKPKPS